MIYNNQPTINKRKGKELTFNFLYTLKMFHLTKANN